MRSEADLRWDAVNANVKWTHAAYKAAELMVPANTKTESCPRRLAGRLRGWRVKRILEYIEDQLNCGVTTRSMAAHVGLSASHFCRAFKQSLGQSPHRYLMTRRLVLACELLMNSELGLAQIATDCGLADQAHFSKLFRQFLGSSPGAWRRAHAVPADQHRRRLHHLQPAAVHDPQRIASNRPTSHLRRDHQSLPRCI
jgi:transcriptional regulator GlxA family with amidase domain